MKTMSFNRRVALARDRIAGTAEAVCEGLDAAARVDPERVAAVYRDTPVPVTRADRVMKWALSVATVVSLAATWSVFGSVVLVDGDRPIRVLVFILGVLAMSPLAGAAVFVGLADAREIKERARNALVEQKIREMIDADRDRLRNPVARYAWMIVEAGPERLAALGADPEVVQRARELVAAAEPAVVDLIAEQERWTPDLAWWWLPPPVPTSHPLVAALADMAAEATALADEQRLRVAASDSGGVPDGVHAETPVSALRWEMSRASGLSSSTRVVGC